MRSCIDVAAARRWVVDGDRDVPARDVRGLSLNGREDQRENFRLSSSRSVTRYLRHGRSGSVPPSA